MITGASPTALRCPFSRSSSWASAPSGVSDPLVAVACRAPPAGATRQASSDHEGDGHAEGGASSDGQDPIVSGAHA